MSLVFLANVNCPEEVEDQTNDGTERTLRADHGRMGWSSDKAITERVKFVDISLILNS
jgi:hypothetical protein